MFELINQSLTHPYSHIREALDVNPFKKVESNHDLFELLMNGNFLNKIISYSNLMREDL